MLTLEPIPAFEDNYIWAMHDGACAAFVDPGEAAPILAWLAQRRIRPVAILVTHHHGDHTGGIAELSARYPGLPVYGPARETIAGLTHRVGEGDVCRIETLGIEMDVLDVPGHTAGHVAYVGHGWLFCGDTLFSCGCGKVFSGTAEQLHASLSRLAALPADTLVCCAHEYTLDNLRFALHVDPDNWHLRNRHEEARTQRHSGLPTLPVTLESERLCNPFLRVHRPEIRRQLADLTGTADDSCDEEAFATLRNYKNNFDNNIK